MNTSSPKSLLSTMGFLIVLVAPCLAADKPKPMRLPLDENLKSPILWGAECVRPDGTGLAFGGQDRDSDDGQARTRLRAGEAWKPVSDELRAANPLGKLRDQALCR